VKEFERLLAAFRGGTADLDTLQAEVAGLVGGSDRIATEALLVLEAARADGLSSVAYSALRRQLTALSGESATMLGTATPVDDSTTAMHRGLGEPEGPTELNPAAGYTDEDIARRQKTLSNDPPETPPEERPDPTITDMGVVGTGEEPTGTMWPGLYNDLDDGTPEREFQKGEVLRSRFRLIAKLGEGGMGAVWKGKDLLKEEAKDRNPYVAIKLLQADFKRHPEAFIALQRETSKQQRLAHPNIATVYDFDRDERTQTVFMTMEVMEGQPMDAFIRALPDDGLPVEEAMGIIEQLAAGLAYAHDNGLVHSDLKPGNCFITSDETVKLLDFGIARASKSKGDAEEGETTLFDPAELGALTPTYATLEMFEGEDPDPRDDIFALAILAYQLFTGRHPYNKKSAPKAKELGLRPARVGKLSKRQNRGLARGLALHREQRTQSVEQFLNDIRRRHSTATYVATGALAASLLVGVLAYKPLIDLVNQRRHEDVINALERPGMENIRNALTQAARLGDQELRDIMEDERTRRAVVAHIGQAEGERLDEWLAFVQTFPTELRRDILDDERARTAIVEHFEGRTFAAFDPARRRFDFARARQQVTLLENLYPDSAAALRIQTEIEARRENALDRLRDRFNRYLEAGLLIPDEGRQYIGDVLDSVRRMAPSDDLLKDDRLRLRYGELAAEARDAGNHERAAALVRAGLEYAPDDPALSDLRYQVERDLARAASQQRAAEVERRLAGALGSSSTMEDFAAHRDDLLVLAELDPGSATLVRARTRLERIMSSEFERLLKTPDYDGAWQMLTDHAPLLSLEFLRAARDRLPNEISVHGDGRLSRILDDARIRERVNGIAAQLDEAGTDSAWHAALERPYKELIVLLPAEHEVLHLQRDIIAAHFLSEARRARRAASFNEARIFIDSGRVFHPGFPPFDIETQALADARAELQARREVERLAAQVVSLKAEFRGKAETNQVQEAKSLILELRELGLAENDPFLVDEAPRGLADAYARLAASRAAQQDYTGAASLARGGLRLWPDHTELRARLAGYEIALENQRFLRALRTRMSSLEPLDVSDTAAALARLEARYPNRYEELASELAESRARAILEHARATQPIGESMAEQLSTFVALFPAQRSSLPEDLVGVAEQRMRRLAPGSVADVQALQPVVENLSRLAPAERGRLRTVLADVVIAAARRRGAVDPEEARRMLSAAHARLPEQERLVNASLALPLQELDDARARLDAGSLTGAAQALDAAERKAPRHPEIPQLREALDRAMGVARRAYAEYAADIGEAEARQQRDFDKRHAGITAMWKDNPGFERLHIDAPRQGECHDDLAGYGAHSGGTCYDLIAGRKGPEMVVVPAGNGLDKAYAIGKYEVSVTDFNHFCEFSRRCVARGGSERRNPLTGISVSDAEDYARWLSEQASKNNGHRVVYRLPTAEEWEHAAKADGQQPEQKFNCRVVSAGEVIAGHALVNARSGRQNGWGLANYAGNAREWVRNPQSLNVRGGAYDDPLTSCGPELDEAHSGEADDLTGFRLVRELG
jgi:serine/threonine protein kinase